MCIGIAVLAEDEVVGGAENGDGLGGAVIAYLRADVLAGEGVGGVDVLVAEQTKLGVIGLAVEDGSLFIAEITCYFGLSGGSRFWSHHFCLLACLPPSLPRRRN